MTATTPSITQRKAESERARMALEHTVLRMRSELSDATSKIQTRTSPGHMLAMLRERSLQNPLQAVAIGAGLAYPLARLVGAVPGPILLIGAGILLGSKRAQPLLQRGNDALIDTAASIGTSASDMMGKAERLVVGETTGEDAQPSLAARANATFADGRESAEAGVSAVIQRASDAASKASDQIADSFSSVKQTTSDATRQSATAVEAFARQNPLLVGGAAIAIGAFIAAALPRTKVETQVAGGVSADMQHRARSAAHDRLKSTKDTIDRAVDHAQASADEQGITTEAAQSAAQEFTNKIISVAEKGIDAGLRIESESPSTDASNPSQTHRKAELSS